MSKERINVLKSEIAARISEIEDLTKKMMSEETDVQKRFVIWVNNGMNKKTKTSIPGGSIRSWCDKHLDLGSLRGVVNLLDYDDAFGLFCLSDEEIKEYECQTDLDKLKKDEIFVSACEQMMKENIDSFVLDW